MDIKEKVLEGFQFGYIPRVQGLIDKAIELTLAEVEKVIDEVLDSKKSKRIIDKSLKEKGIPKEFAFQEKYFYLAQDLIKEELKLRLRGKQ